MAVELRKSGDKVNLRKSGTLGPVTVNLKWNTKGNERKVGLLFKKTVYDPIDLDLECLYELYNGRKGCVHAINDKFGNFDQAPYIHLDGDDRTGDSDDGETVRINGAKISEIKRILIFTSIYDGIANWKDANAVVTVKCPGGDDVIVRMDQYNSTDKICAIAMLENAGDTFSVEKLVKFFTKKPLMDQEYNWGLNWVPGKKS